MKKWIKGILKDLKKIRTDNPLVHNMTNYVVMNVTANALLAVGASPVMAHAPEEVEEMVGLSKALVVNIGTLSRPWVSSMKTAMLAACKKGLAVVLDPVGAGATRFRTQTALELLTTSAVRLIRANASEVLALAGKTAMSKGVDSLADASDAEEAAEFLSDRYGCTVCISGALDRVIDRGRVAFVANGHPWMSRVTGMGCCASALCGAFVAINEDTATAAVHAMAVMGLSGEQAAERASGPGTFVPHFLDALWGMDAEVMAQRLRITEKSGWSS